MSITTFILCVKVIGITLLISALIWACYLWGWQAGLILLMLAMSHNIDKHFPSRNVLNDKREW